MNRRLHWVTGSVATILAVCSGLLLSGVFSQQRQVSAANEGGAQRSAIYAPAAPGALAFSPGQRLVRPPFPTTLPIKDQDIEPEIKCDLFGNIYVTGMHGYPGGVDLWKSTDNGATFTWLGQPDGAQDKCGVEGTPTCVAGAGGGDDSIDVSSGGYLYVSSLYVANTTVSTSFDGGMGGVLPGQAWQVNPKANGDPPIPVNDRQWLAAYGAETVYMTFDNAPVNAGIWFTKSTNAGKTFSPPVNITGGTGTIRRSNNMAVDQYNGNIYATYTPVNLPNQLNLLKSIDGGTTWTVSSIYTGPAGTSVENAFPIIAVDRGGNLHVVFTKSDGVTSRTNVHVFLMSSTNQGATWLPPVQVDSGANTQSSVMPWVVAGSPGVVDITWYGSSSASPDSAPFDWHVFFAQTNNALSATPTFTQVVAFPDQVHDNAICSAGGACTGRTRDLAEYYSMTLDRDGNALIAFVNSIQDCTASNCYAYTWFTKQTSGPSAYNPPSAPGPATFAANVNVTGSGAKAEPNSWVDSHNCIFGGAIGGPTAFKSQDGGTSFTAKNVVVGTGTHGGDFDIITVPKADGSRPDQIYTVDLGITSVHVGKSNDGGLNYAAPSATSGEVSISSDRMWLYPDRNVPNMGDQTVYLNEHELASEIVRVQALTNDGVWSPFSNATSSPDLILPPNGTLPNTNPGPIFVNPTNHDVICVFAAASTTTNAQDPPFGKMMNVWAAVGAKPAAAGLPPGQLNPMNAQYEMTNYPIFKGVIDSPAAAPSPAPSIPPSARTYGNHCGNLFPSGAGDSAGNIYAVWMTNNSRANTVQTGTTNPSTTFDIWLAASHDGGKNFYGPWRVSSGTGTCVQPWIAAGDNGRVDIVWYQSDKVPPPLVADPASPGALSGGSNNMPAGSTWNVMFAQSLNANGREPVFTVSQASDHIIHTGSISNGGLTGSSDRSLLDFFEVAIGPDGVGNIFSADNGTSALHINYMRQNSGSVALTNPSFVTCLPIPPLASVVSRKVHGGAGTFDINLPLTGTRGVEDRSPGQTGTAGFDYKIVFTFVNNITSCGTTPPGGGSVVSGPNANQCTVNRNGIPNAQYTTVTLNGVADVAGNNGPVSAVIGLLVGDVNASGVVTSGDTNLCKAQALQTVTNSNFRNDINASGAITTGDVNIIKQNALTQLPTPP
jgi:hypothetical protein